MKSQIKTYAPYILLFCLLSTVVVFRPVLPIDETRYLTVAWEMFLQKNYTVLSLNFAPYHHKPPMLFWLINGAWTIFGVSRWAAMLPIFAASASVMFLTKFLAEKLQEKSCISIPWLMLGSMPFLIYSTMILFDVMVAVCVLSTLIVVLDYTCNPNIYRLLIAGLIMGLGVLTKGPVMYLYVLWPMALYYFWRQPHYISNKSFYKTVPFIVFISVIPVCLWLIPTLAQTNKDFAFWLIWEQTAGRITGKMGSSHIHSFAFYFYCIPVLFLPWVFLPSFWKKIPPNAFLLCTTVPVFLSFSLIAGKQPHYIIPLLPFVIIFISMLLHKTRIRIIKTLSISMVVLFILVHIIASYTFFYKYDLRPIAQIIKDNPNADFVFTKKYNGELGFLARLQKPMHVIKKSDLVKWFKEHPNGFAIFQYSTEKEIKEYSMFYTMPYKGKNLSVLRPIVR